MVKEAGNMVALSRRKFINASIVLGASSCLPRALRASSGYAAVHVDGTGTAIDDFLAVVAASDRSASKIIARKFPGLQKEAGFDRVQPFAFLVTNKTAHAIKAFQSHWIVENGDDRFEWQNLHFFTVHSAMNPRMHWGLKGNRTRYTAQAPVIKANASRVLTPFCNFSSKYFHNGSRPSWQEMIAKRSRPEMATIQSGKADLKVSMSIDALITNDFRVVGSNYKKLVNILLNTRNAEHDEALVVAQIINKGGSREDVASVLQHHSLGIGFDTTSETEIYNKARQRQALVLMRRLTYARWDQFIRTVQFLTDKPETGFSLA
jgi:hypothetical protein